MQPHKLLSLSMIIVVFASLTARLRAAPDTFNEVTRWDDIATTAAAASQYSNFPLPEARVYAMMSIAVHDALNSIDKRNRSYVYHQPSAGNASRRAAIAAAAHRVLIDQFGRAESVFGLPSQQNFLDQAYQDSLASIPDGQRKRSGIFAGESSAAAILALRVNDGWEAKAIADPNYPQGTGPGEYRFTGTTMFAFAPDWGALLPFASRDGEQFLPPPPYDVRSRRYAADLNEIKLLGGNGTTTPSTRTAYETVTARFWLESSPPMWNRIARNAAERARPDLWESARLFALLNIGMADGYIGSFEAKYRYRFWRPETAIRLADSDGNPLTSGDPSWTPLVETPPIPDYDSGHATEGGVAARVLERFFGRDRFRFSTCSASLLPGFNCGEPQEIVREYRSFSEAAEENGVSRILVGFHFRLAVDAGIRHGQRIADWVVDRYLQERRER